MLCEPIYNINVYIIIDRPIHVYRHGFVYRIHDTGMMWKPGSLGDPIGEENATFPINTLCGTPTVVRILLVSRTPNCSAVALKNGS